MKKYFVIMVLGLMLSTSVSAAWTEANCNEAKGGSIVTIGSQTFCKANTNLNWWSGYAWCQAMGGHLPTVTEMCPGATITEGNSCGYTYSEAWTTTPRTNDDMYRVNSKIVGYTFAVSRKSERAIYCLSN